MTNLCLTERRRGPGWCAFLLTFAVGSGVLACSDGAPITGPALSTAPAAPAPAVSAATVSLKGARSLRLPSFADTLTDANGRYLLCSVGNSEVAVFVEARKEGYMPSSAEGLPWFGWNLDFELTRRSESLSPSQTQSDSLHL